MQAQAATKRTLQAIPQSQAAWWVSCGHEKIRLMKLTFCTTSSPNVNSLDVDYVWMMNGRFHM